MLREESNDDPAIARDGIVSRDIGIIGLGNMGGPFASRLLEAGYQLFVSDLRADIAELWAKKGAVICSSPREMADSVETVCLSLPLPDVVRDVVFGDDGLADGQRLARVIDLSTTGPDISHEIASRLSERGLALIDAPVSGGVVGAEAGTVAVMLACAADQTPHVRPILEVLGRVFLVGSEPGQGQIAKVLNNLLSAGSLLLAGEATALGAKAGLDPEGMIDVFNAGSGRSSATLDKYPKAILPGTFSLGFTNRLMFKDVSLSLTLAESMGLDLPTARAVRDEWQAAMESVGPDEDFSRIVTKSEQMAGVAVRSGKSR